MLIWLTALCLSSAAPAAHAGPDRLTEWQKSMLLKQVDDYFKGGKSSLTQLEAFHSIRPWQPTLELLLKDLRVRTQGELSPNATNKTISFMNFLTNLSRRVEVPESERARQALRAPLHDLLARFPWTGEIRRLILEMFDALQLWSTKELWLFLHIHDSHDLKEHAGRIRFLMSRLDPEQTRHMAETLRAVRPNDLLQYALLMETGHMKESELISMLKQASIQFALSLARSTPEQDEEFLNERLIDQRSQIVSEKLDELMQSLKDGDAAVGSAFTKAVKQARRQSSKSYKSEDRLLFFTLMQEGRLDWYDRSTWRGRAQQIAQENISIKERYQVRENVILVRFGVRKNCAEDL